VVFVEELNKNRPDFYSLMGPFFGSRSVAKEIGIHVYDDSNKRWFAAFDGELVGFASYRNGLVSDCYVLPNHRNAGVFACILASLCLLTNGNLRAMCTQASKKAFFNAGFVQVKTTKNFTLMEMKRAKNKTR
jgi:hypothetical protein